tara:strand:+ start:158 stop:409 length:252 start_codon:yes stop_codon:yes gene_type:complete
MKVFGFTRKLIKKLVMGSNFANVIIGNKQQEQQKTPLSSDQLSTSEIEVLLSLIKRSTFLGDDIENLYNLVVKLQKQYIEQTK